MVILRDEVHPEGAARSFSPPPPLVVVPRPTGGDASGRLLGSSIFAGQGFFYAQCEADDAVGNCVFADSTEAFVSTADEQSPEPVIGIIVAKSSDSYCTVQRFGESSIAFDGLVPGQRYFLGPKGSIIAPPFDDEMPEFVQQVGNAISTSQLFIQPTGKVTRRIINRDFVLNLGQGDPLPNGKYPRTDLYIDQSTVTGPAAYFSPTMEGEDSVILVGNGPPSADQAADAQAVYRDADGNLYFADGSGSPNADVSAIIFGNSQPTGTETPSNNVYYLDTEQNDLEAFPRTGVTGAS